MSGQAIFESAYEDPHVLNTAFVVHVTNPERTDLPSHFIYRITSMVKSDWSRWRLPDAVETVLPSELTSLLGSRLGPADLNVAPRIRTRAEYLNNYDRSRQTRERYNAIPVCD